MVWVITLSSVAIILELTDAIVPIMKGRCSRRTRVRPRAAAIKMMAIVFCTRHWFRFDRHTDDVGAGQVFFRRSS